MGGGRGGATILVRDTSLWANTASIPIKFHEAIPNSYSVTACT